MARDVRTRLTPPPGRRSRAAVAMELAAVEAELGSPLAGLEVTDFARLLSTMSAPARSKLTRDADRLLEMKKHARYAPARISLVKLLIAALPQSASLISRRVIEAEGRYADEVRFSIFCFLDQIRLLPAGANHDDFVLELVGDFLQNVRSNTAHAAWMAGDLLGDHWPLELSVPALLRLAEGARFVAGRDSAIHGLSHAIGASSTKRANEIRSILARVARSDRSGVVRASARLALTGRAPFAVV